MRERAMKERILQLQPYKPGKSPEQIKREYNVDNVIKLASNENAFGCSPTIAQAVNKALKEVSTYPDGHAELLRKKVAEHVNVKETELLFGAGLDEVIQILSRVLLCEGSNIVTADQTFVQYKHHAVIEGAEIREVPLINGHFNLDEMASTIDNETKIVWICNPNNPTGTYVSEKELMNFLQKIPRHVTVVLDEAYYEYVMAEDYPQTIPFIKDYKNLIVLRTFSKAYGLASLRIGYAVGNENLIEKLNIGRLPFNTSTLAQVAAAAALEDQDFIKYTVEETRKGILFFEQELNTLGISYYPSQTNFIFIHAKNPKAVFTKFIEKGYIVRPMANGIRISIGTMEQNQGVINILKDNIDKSLLL
jgi:histidinol-phosphate aminotransferase